VWRDSTKNLLLESRCFLAVEAHEGSQASDNSSSHGRVESTTFSFSFSFEDGEREVKK
jgi:hypothetical protein